MCAFQREIGLMMIEGISIQMHDICVPSDMFRMAGFARCLINIFYAAVKSVLILDVCRHFLVACKT